MPVFKAIKILLALACILKYKCVYSITEWMNSLENEWKNK